MSSLNQTAFDHETVGECTLIRFQVTLEENLCPKPPAAFLHKNISWPLSQATNPEADAPPHL
ncbi:hypothetical protein DY000_02051665 [Brassica cretica]|uniref:Uncharacterized protein n=1 Tax=Brassica cretica TaxID=69181 RepID=A0ABQ7ET35_BRACR|nr:hypothetical protein DY000_02051665 [Brassica cretica]